LTAFVVVTALAVVLQAAVLMAMAIGARKTQEHAMAMVEELRSTVLPILAITKDLLEDSAPRVKQITANLEHTSQRLSQQSDHLSVVVDDALRRTQRHVQHADMIVTETLDSVDDARSAVTQMVAQPLRWATAVANGLRVGVESFFARKTSSSPFADGFRAAHGADETQNDAEEVFD
jgi:ElaB/YqjD/DUF883 family membrane-anchored ribosome-binding protein